MTIETALRQHTYDILAALCNVRDFLDANDPDFEGTEVRVYYHPDEDAWRLCTGDPSYDQDHRGLCGASWVAADMEDADVEAVVGEILDQILEMAAYYKEG